MVVCLVGCDPVCGSAGVLLLAVVAAADGGLVAAGNVARRFSSSCNFTANS